MRAQLDRVARILAASHVRYAPLKGAARVANDAADAVLHPSGDLDILVPPDRVDDAVAAFRAAGYLPDAADRSAFYATHHHVAPLYPPGKSGFTLELHVALARPDTLSLATDWNALQPHLVRLPTLPGEGYVLDTPAAALHLAIHARDLSRLRDVALCAALLRECSAAELTALDNLVVSECVDRVRLEAAVALSTRVAGIARTPCPGAAAYIEWALRRNDMPVMLGRRSYAAEAWYAGGCSGDFPPAILFADEPTPLRIAARAALFPLTLLYAALLPGNPA
jgi:hypothetical protein